MSLDGGVEREAERARREVDGAVQEVDGPGEHVHRCLVQLVGRELQSDFKVVTDIGPRLLLVTLHMSHGSHV